MTRRSAVGVLNGNWKNRWRDDLYEIRDNENSLYWRSELTRAMEIIIANPAMEAVWDSDLVPNHTTYKGDSHA